MLILKIYCSLLYYKIRVEGQNYIRNNIRNGKFVKGLRSSIKFYFNDFRNFKITSDH